MGDSKLLTKPTTPFQIYIKHVSRRTRNLGPLHLTLGSYGHTGGQYSLAKIEQRRKQISSTPHAKRHKGHIYLEFKR